MSERERWVVYPLLFLALGAALRDKLLKQTEVDQIVCKQLIVNDGSGTPVAVISGPEMQLGRLRAEVVDATQIRQSGRPVGASRSSTATIPLSQFLPWLQALQGQRTQPQANPPADGATDRPAAGETPNNQTPNNQPPPAITIPSVDE